MTSGAAFRRGVAERFRGRGGDVSKAVDAFGPDVAEALEGIPLREGVTRAEAVEHLCVRLAQTLGAISAPWFRLKPAHLARPSYRTLRALRARYGPDAVFRLDAPPEHVPTLEAFLTHGGPRQRLDGMLANVIREVSEVSVSVSVEADDPAPIRPALRLAEALAAIIGEEVEEALAVARSPRGAERTAVRIGASWQALRAYRARGRRRSPRG